MSKQWFKSQSELLFVYRVDDGLNTKSYLVQREYRVDDGLNTKSYLVQREYRVDDGLNTKSYLVQREYRVDNGLDTKSYLVQRELLFVYRVDDGLNTKELSVMGLRKCEQLFWPLPAAVSRSWGCLAAAWRTGTAGSCGWPGRGCPASGRTPPGTELPRSPANHHHCL